MRKALFILIMVMGENAGNNLKAQIQPSVLEKGMEEQIELNVLLLKYPSQVKEFYKNYHYNTAWITNDLTRAHLLNYLETAADLGLKKEDYQFSFIQSFRTNSLRLVTSADSMAAEFRFTDAAIHFFNDVANGNHAPAIGYNGLNYHPDCIKIPLLLSSALIQNRDMVKNNVLIKPEIVSVNNLQCIKWNL